MISLLLVGSMGTNDSALAEDLKPVRRKAGLGFELPRQPWASALDSESGNLAISDDEHGFQIYNVDKLAAGDTAPVGDLPVDGLPTAVCFKQLPDRGVFVVTGQDAETLRIYDSSSFQLVTDIPLPDTSRPADLLAASTHPADPFVYFAVGNYPVVKNKTSQVSRLDLVKLLFDEQSVSVPVLNELYTTTDGRMLIACQREKGKVSGGFSRSEDTITPLLAVTPHSTFTSNADAEFLTTGGDAITTNRLLSFSQFRNGGTSKGELMQPLCCFQDKPVCVGLTYEKNRLIFASMNTHAWLAAIEMPPAFSTQADKDALKDSRRHKARQYNLSSRFLDMHADDKRSQVVVIQDRFLYLIKLADANVPSEPMLQFEERLPFSVQAGAAMELDLVVPEGAETSFVLGKDYWYERLDFFAYGHAGQLEPKLTLAAAIGDGKRVLVTDVRWIMDKPRPFKIKVGDEIMTVTDYDSFTDSLIVERENPEFHSIRSDVTIILEGEDKLVLPVVKNNVLKWTPPTDKLGIQTILLRITRGKLSRLVPWEPKLELNSLRSSEQDYWFTAISERDDTTVFVGGQHFAKDAEGVEQDNSYFIGIYDIKKRTLADKLIVPAEVESCVAVDDFLYLLVRENPKSSQFDVMQVTTDLQKVNKTVRAIEPSTRKLERISNRYLVGRNVQHHVPLFELPGLKSILPEKPESKESKPDSSSAADINMGAVGDGWLWKNALWDADLKKVRLLLQPPGVGRSQTLKWHAHSPIQGTLSQSVNGTHLWNWEPLPGNSFGPLVDLGLPGLCAGWRVTDTELQFFDWEATWLPEGSGSFSAKKSIGLTRVKDRKPVKEVVGLAQCGDEVVVAMEDQLLLFSREEFPIPEVAPIFRLKEEQDEILLPLDKTAELSYSAPGAGRYTVQFWLEPPEMPTSPTPLGTFSSTDGKFEIPIPDIADEIAKHHHGCLPGTPNYKKYRDTTAKEIEQLTGKNPEGVHVPLLAYVSAEHQDGIRKTAMMHYYLVNVPPAKLKRR